jgi:hypothetical protein
VTDLQQLSPQFPGHIDLVGKEYDLACRHEAYQGRQVERWLLRWRKPLDLDAIGRLNERFAHILKDAGGDAAAPEPPAAA